MIVLRVGVGASPEEDLAGFLVTMGGVMMERSAIIVVPRLEHVLRRDVDDVVEEGCAGGGAMDAIYLNRDCC